MDVSKLPADIRIDIAIMRTGQGSPCLDKQIQKKLKKLADDAKR